MGVYIYQSGTEKELKNAYIGSTPAKRIMMRPNGVEKQVRPKRLPSVYQEVEWIGTNSSAGINTGIAGASNIGAWTEALYTGTRNDVPLFFGDRASSSYRWGMITYPSGCRCPQWETWHATYVNYSIDTWYDIKFNWNNNRQTLIDGTNIYSLSSASFTSPDEIKISQEGYTGYGAKIKFFKLSNGTTLVRDFVPCYRKADGVIGMYDLVNNQFYTNYLSGTFTKGPDV